MTGPRGAYLRALAGVMGLPVERFGAAGTTVCAGQDRRGGRLVSHYRVGAHSVLWCDPDLVDLLAVHDGAATAMTLDEFRLVAVETGAEPLGRGYEHLLPEGWSAPRSAAGTVRLDGDAEGTSAAVHDLLDECVPDDRDEADFDPGALDPYLCGWLDGGRLVALAGARPWRERPGCHDVGVIVSPALRRRGLGHAVVSAVSAAVLAAGERPLYRCGADNTGSVRLCETVGYRRVVELEAFRWSG